MVRVALAFAAIWVLVPLLFVTEPGSAWQDFVVALAVAATAVFPLGVPLFVLLYRRGLLKLLPILGGGALVGALWAAWVVYGSQPVAVDGAIEWPGHSVPFIPAMTLLGAVHGALFWLIAVPWNPFVRASRRPPAVGAAGLV